MSLLATMPTSRCQVVAIDALDILNRDRRKKRRVPVPCMYSTVTLRILADRKEPLEGHIRDLSESGMCVELDELVPIGAPVAIEFCLSGLGRFRGQEWPQFAATAEVTRHDDLDDFPQGPYKIALRFVKLPTMTQAQIARYVAVRACVHH